MDNEPFSNPLAPPSAIPAKADNQQVADRSQPLTNDDFRKLMMTPRAVMQGQSSMPGSVRGSVRSKRNYKEKIEQNENIKKKKKIHELIRKQEDNVLNELAKKYRDRAKERREGVNTDTLKDSEILPSTAYHAVGPDNFNMDAAERRRLMIQESKYLGGDMEHTHLVKGLDYVLLQKVKAEMESREDDETFLKQMEEEEQAKREEEEEEANKKSSNKKEDGFDDQDRYALKSKRAQNLLKIVFNKNLPERNELFIQGRMAYQYDLTREFMDNEIPTTIIRSKAECPNLDAYNSISTNEIIINKLIQIWTCIRQGASKKQRRKLESSKNEKAETKFKDIGEDIFDDVGDYIPDIKSKRSSATESNKGGKSEKKKSYFESTAPKQQNQEEDENDDDSMDQKQAMELAAQVVGSFASTSAANMPVAKKAKYQEPESYAECYPGAPENDDAILDSDDDDDFDDGKTEPVKKSFSKRWEFENDEEYGEFLSNKEVLPKALYQYGKKNSDDRNNPNPMGNRQMRRGGGPKKDEKAKLDREYQKINALINNKKQKGEKIGMSYMSNDNYRQ